MRTWRMWMMDAGWSPARPGNGLSTRVLLFHAPSFSAQGSGCSMLLHIPHRSGSPGHTSRGLPGTSRTCKMHSPFPAMSSCAGLSPPAFPDHVPDEQQGVPSPAGHQADTGSRTPCNRGPLRGFSCDTLGMVSLTREQSSGTIARPCQ